MEVAHFTHFRRHNLTLAEQSPNKKLRYMILLKFNVIREYPRLPPCISNGYDYVEYHRQSSHFADPHFLSSP